MTDIVAWRWRFKGHGPNAPWYYTTEVLQPESYKEMQGLVLATEWQPIETAPKDGDVIVLCYGEPAGEVYGPRGEMAIMPAKYGPGDYQGFDWIVPDTDVAALWMKPTHWMPLPAPPVVGGSNG